MSESRKNNDTKLDVVGKISVDNIIREVDEEKFKKDQLKDVGKGLFVPPPQNTRDSKREQPGTADRNDPTTIIPHPGGT